MDLLKNPFHVLAVTPWDSKESIIEAAEERSLMGDPVECSNARSILIHPQKRISAEIAWLPGIFPLRVPEVLSFLQNEIRDLPKLHEFTPMAQANLLAAGLGKIPEDLYVIWITRLSETFEAIDVEDLLITFNRARSEGGFVNISDLDVVQREIQKRREYFRLSLKASLDRLPTSKLIDVMESLAASPSFLLTDDLIDLYEMEAALFFDKEKANIATLADKMQKLADLQTTNLALNIMINRLVEVVKNWMRVAGPIQVNYKKRGRTHRESRNIGIIIQQLAVFLYQNHGKLDHSVRVNKILKDYFSEVDEIQEIAAKDDKIFRNIAEQKKEWADDITFEADLGRSIEDRIRISPEGIEYEGQCWPLDSITRLRWGEVRFQNGIFARTEYAVFWGDDASLTSCSFREESVYVRMTGCLWRAIGLRLLSECLQALSEGKSRTFGKIIVDDSGVRIPAGRWFSGEKLEYCPWSEANVWNEEGVFCVGTGYGKNYVALPYLQEDNIHILEVMLKTSLESGTNRLSDLLHV
ncbi:MAG: hypothetical protein LBQ90_02090, partial [Synergistaceae bacterium]|nr:hypothetical protein [Synergistaceae bacterium]